jgi:hypothetical protein
MRFQLLLLLILVTLSCPMQAQTDRGAIEGLVTDPSGAAVPSAQVQVVQIDTNSKIDLATNENGMYFAPNLPLGSYRIILEKKGFHRIVREPVLIRAQTHARVDFTFQVGDVSENVSVTGEAPMLDISTTSLATGLTTQFIDQLPLILSGEKRSITQYLQFTPGTSSNDTMWTARVNGALPGDTEVFIDGAPGSEWGTRRGSIEENGPSIEQVGEFSVVANAFNAEYGGYGSWFTNVTIRSGTNVLHGSVYDHFGNDKLDARSFFQAKRAIVRKNEGGFTAGGPVFIPKIYDGRNKTFFFFGQGLFWSRQGAVGNLLTIPREDFRRGNFGNLVDGSGALIPIFDPATTSPDGKGSFVRDQFPGNIIPSARISQPSQKIIALMPAPDLPAQQTNNWHNRTGAFPMFDTWVSTMKFDHSVSDKQKISVTYSHQTRPRQIHSQGWGIDPLEGFQTQTIQVQTGRINHDYIFRPTLLNHFTAGVDRYINPANNSSVGQGWDQKLGILGLPGDLGPFPQISFSGGTAAPLTMGLTNNSYSGQTRYSFDENLTWIRGRHTMKFGASHWRYDVNSRTLSSTAGAFNFSNNMTSQPDAGANLSRWGSAFASFLLGEINTVSATIPFALGMRYRAYSLFAQDEWRMTTRLTLSYGLRWDVNTRPYEVADRMSSFDPTIPNPGAGGRLGALAFAGQGPGRIGGQFLDTWKNGFGPRLGAAYQMNSKTVLRASGGIYYATAPVVGTSAAGFSASPAFNSPDGYTGVYNWGSSGFPQNFARPPFIDPSFQNGQAITWMVRDGTRLPQILSWTVGIQRELAPNFSLDVSYIGSHSTHLSASPALSQVNVVDASYLPLGNLLLQRIDSPAAAAAGIPLPFPGFAQYTANTVAQALMPYPQYIAVNKGTAHDPIGIARFNSLQVKATKRYSNGLTLLAFYTWMKNLTNVEGGVNNGDGNIQYPLNRAGEVSVSQDGPPHVVVFSGAYDLPFGPGKRLLKSANPIVARFVGGWNIVAYVRRGSGQPLSITTGNNLSALGYPAKRADFVAGQPVHLTSNPRDFDPAVNRYLNPSAFAVPASFALGNSARELDWARGFSQKSESVSIGKVTPLTEKVRLLLRAEIVNPFNFVRWNDPNTSISSADFGKVTGTAMARTMELYLSLEF